MELHHRPSLKTGSYCFAAAKDDGSIFGIEKDIETLPRKDIDSFERTLMGALANFALGVHLQYVHSSFEERDGKTVCVVVIEKAAASAYFEVDGGKAFYIRRGASTTKLDVEAAVKYCEMHWPRR